MPIMFGRAAWPSIIMDGQGVPSITLVKGILLWVYENIIDVKRLYEFQIHAIWFCREVIENTINAKCLYKTELRSLHLIVDYFYAVSLLYSKANQDFLAIDYAYKMLLTMGSTDMKFKYIRSFFSLCFVNSMSHTHMKWDTLCYYCIFKGIPIQ